MNHICQSGRKIFCVQACQGGSLLFVEAYFRKRVTLASGPRVEISCVYRSDFGPRFRMNQKFDRYESLFHFV